MCSTMGCIVSFCIHAETIGIKKQIEIKTKSTRGTKFPISQPKKSWCYSRQSENMNVRRSWKRWLKRYLPYTMYRDKFGTRELTLLRELFHRGSFHCMFMLPICRQINLLLYLSQYIMLVYKASTFVNYGIFLDCTVTFYNIIIIINKIRTFHRSYFKQYVYFVPRRTVH